MENLQPVEKAAGLLHGIYFLRGLTFPLMYTLLIGMVVTGTAPSFTTPGAMLRLSLAIVVIAVADRFRQRFYLDPKRERGTHWRALLLQFAKWPFLLLALVRALRGPSREYHATQKARMNPSSLRFAFVHLFIASAIAAAWLIGTIGSTVPVTLTIACLAIVLLSVGLAWTAFWHYPNPFDPALWTRRRAEFSDLFVNRSSSRKAEAVSVKLRSW